jgi:hypothetical protein
MRIVLIGCGALVREVRAVLGQFSVASGSGSAGPVAGAGLGGAGLGGAGLDVGGRGPEVVAHYLPASLHNRPDRICNAIRAAFVEHVQEGDRVIVGYADCGTGGHLDTLATELGFTRLPGSHCYEFFAGAQVFADLADAEPGTFYLTDYLARHFEPLIMGALGIDKHPELRDMYFGNYARVVFLDQMSNPDLLVAAQAAATRLGLAFEHHPTGLDPFAVAVRDLVTAAVAA